MTYADRGDSRNRIAATTSSIVPIRPAGNERGQRAGKFVVIDVAIGPGATALTVMPKRGELLREKPRHRVHAGFRHAVGHVGGARLLVGRQPGTRVAAVLADDGARC